MSVRRDWVSSLAGWRGVSLKRFRAADPATPELPTSAGQGSCIVNVAATATSPTPAVSCMPACGPSKPSERSTRSATSELSITDRDQGNGSSQTRCFAAIWPLDLSADGGCERRGADAQTAEASGAGRCRRPRVAVSSSSTALATVSP